jgi:hypothetical protein
LLEDLCTFEDEFSAFDGASIRDVVNAECIDDLSEIDIDAAAAQFEQLNKLMNDYYGPRYEWRAILSEPFHRLEEYFENTVFA